MLPSSHEEQQRLVYEETARRAEEERRREEQRRAREAEIQYRNGEAEAEIVRIASDTLDSIPPAALPAEPAAKLPDEEQSVRGHSLQEETAERRPAAQPLRPSVQPMTVLSRKRATKLRMRPRAIGRTRNPVRRRSRIDEWKIAAITATVVAVLLMAAWSLLIDQKPSAPFSSQQLLQDSRIQQEVPFGPATISNDAAKPAAAGLQVIPMPAGLQPGVSRQASSKPPAVITTQKPVQQKSALPRPRRRYYVADDTVVVRHLRPQQSATEASSAVKRFSDVN